MVDSSEVLSKGSLYGWSRMAQPYQVYNKDQNVCKMSDSKNTFSQFFNASISEVLIIDDVFHSLLIVI